MVSDARERESSVKGLWTVMRRLTLAGILALLAVGGGRMPSVALAATSNQIAYIYDDGQAGGPTGVNGNMSIFQLAMCSIGSTGTDCPGFTSGTGSSATYNTGNTTVTLTDVPVSTIDAQGSAALSGYDTLLLYEVCDIGSHATTMAAVNAFLAAGGKVLIFDADRCFSSTPGDPQQTPNYSSFTYPFTTSNPGPDAAGGAYRFIEQSTLTTGLTVGTGNQPGDSVGDANAFTTFNGAWCGSISGINNTGAPGFVQAYAEGPQGTGLVIYEGEDYWATGGGSPGDEPGHLRQVFNNLIDQPFNPDGLPCSVRASGISLTPKSGNEAVGGRHTDTATVVNASGAPISGISVTFTEWAGCRADLHHHDHQHWPGPISVLIHPGRHRHRGRQLSPQQ